MSPYRVVRSACLLLVFPFLTAPVFLSAEAAGPRRVAAPLTAEVAAAVPADLDAARRAELAANGELTVFFRDQPQAGLCPDASVRPALLDALRAVKPTLGLESLAVVPLPAAVAASPDRDLALYNLLHRFRSMEGIEYWSQSRGVMRVFFLKSHLVVSASNRKPLPDPVFDRIAPAQRLYLEQEDSSFGKNLYEIGVGRTADGGIAMDMVNIDQVWYGIVPVLSPRSLSMHLVVKVSDDGRYLYLYGSAGMNVARIAGLDERAQTSYANRINALFAWFVRSVNG